MKSERRHELQHNALLDWLVQTQSTVKPYMNAILLGIVVVLVGFLAYSWLSGQSASQEATAWDSLFLAVNENDTARLDDVTDPNGQYKGTTAAQWAAVVAGDMHLSAGCQQLRTDKTIAADHFKKALEKYTLVTEGSKDPVIQERATFGLARTYESMAATRSEGDLKRARDLYGEVVKEWPNGAYTDAAQARFDAVARPSTKEFYDALAAWEPRPSVMPPGGIEGLNFDDPGSSLDVGSQPDSFFPDLTDRMEDATGSEQEGNLEIEVTPPADNATELPAEEATETPAEGAGATDAPAMPEATGDQATEEAPAEETPVEETPVEQPAAE